MGGQVGMQIFLLGSKPQISQILRPIPQPQIRKFLRCVPVRKSQIRKFARKKAVFLIQIRIGLPLLFFLPT
jgi:hypothetical protein